MRGNFKLKKLTDLKWLNLFEVFYKTKQGIENTWLVCSRKKNPITDAGKADAVFIIATVDTPEGKKLVVTKEFRVAIWDYEYGFAAGLIDEGEDIIETARRELKEETGLDLVEVTHISKPVYSSAGMSDESCHMVLGRAAGTVSDEFLEETEDIETLLLDIDEIKELLASDKKIAAKAWPMLYHYASIGKID